MDVFINLYTYQYAIFYYVISNYIIIYKQVLISIYFYRFVNYGPLFHPTPAYVPCTNYIPMINHGRNHMHTHVYIYIYIYIYIYVIYKYIK